MKNSLLLAVLTALFFSSCESTPSENEDEMDMKSKSPIAEADSIVTSFVFVGCNRLQEGDFTSTESSANTNVLKNILENIAASQTKTDYFFFLGDIVNGEATTQVLEQQLSDWNKEYDAGDFSDFQSTGIKLVAVPGNHEMLYSYPEIPLQGASQIWMNNMRQYMAPNPEFKPGITDVIDSMSYGFTHGNIGFIVLNTDTYNTNALESVFPYDWTKQQVEKYHKDPSIDHIFVMGHRPFYTSACDTCYTNLLPEYACKRNDSHTGVKDTTLSNPVWRSFEDNDVASMLSAHVHQYQRMQINKKTYQLIAGNGGSYAPQFFGYTRINVYASGRIEMLSEGYDYTGAYNDPVYSPTWRTRDSIEDMNWYGPNAPTTRDTCACITGE